MIGRLRGELAGIESTHVLVDCAGVGYEVLVPESVALQLPTEGSQVVLFIRQIFREDGVTLCGFLVPFQRRVFDLLLEVKGCGPKVALALIGQLGEESVAAAILGQDAKSLARATGVGPRLAERIILELKDKMAQEKFQRAVEVSNSRPKAPEDEVVDALLALGYRRAEAEDAATRAGEASSDVEGRLRAALQLLRK